MQLRVLLPFQIFAVHERVRRVVVETATGAFGLLPHRRDCVAALVPGVMVFEDEAGTESFVALDEGVLVKQGANVDISVRNAIAGTDLQRLHERVVQEFEAQDEDDRSLRSVTTKLESGFMHRMADLRGE